MKLVSLTNVSGKKLRIVEARLVFEPGETKKVHPATVQHPSVRRYLGGFIMQGTQETIEKVEPIKAPVPQRVSQAAVIPQVSQPNAGNAEPVTTVVGNTVPVVQATSDDAVKTDTVEPGDLRELYLSAPGITYENVEAILEAFGTIPALIDADKDVLNTLGVSKTKAKKLLAWAKEQSLA